MMISVVVTITDGEWHLDRCLSSLLAQGDDDCEIIVPFHGLDDRITLLKEKYPEVRFVEIHIPLSTHADERGLAHLIYDLRRAAGLVAATGDLIAITEDHAIPSQQWLAAIRHLHQELPCGIIGGPIDHIGTGILNQAIYLCDFGRYRSPVRSGPARYVSDVNVSYKRAALEKIRDVWQDFYHETQVHDSLRAGGETLWLSSQMRVQYDRGALHASTVMRERVRWGRVYAGRRAQNVSLSVSLTLTVLAVFLPLLLFGRRTTEVIRKSSSAFQELITCTPWLLALLCAWTFGEMTGYLTRRPFTDDIRVLDHSAPTASVNRTA